MFLLSYFQWSKKGPMNHMFDPSPPNFTSCGTLLCCKLRTPVHLYSVLWLEEEGDAVVKVAEDTSEEMEGGRNQAWNLEN